MPEEGQHHSLKSCETGLADLTGCLQRRHNHLQGSREQGLPGPWSPPSLDVGKEKSDHACVLKQTVMPANPQLGRENSSVQKSTLKRVGAIVHAIFNALTTSKATPAPRHEKKRTKEFSNTHTHARMHAHTHTHTHTHTNKAKATQWGTLHDTKQLVIFSLEEKTIPTHPLLQKKNKTKPKTHVQACTNACMHVHTHTHTHTKQADLLAKGLHKQ